MNVGSAALSYSIQMFDSSGTAMGNAVTGTTHTPTQFQYALELSETTAPVQAEGRLNSPITLTLTAKDNNGQILDTVNGSVTVEAALTGGSAELTLEKTEAGRYLFRSFLPLERET